jgi:hypothetical protein
MSSTKFKISGFESKNTHKKETLTSMCISLTYYPIGRRVIDMN